ncbi:diacylglycerol kinase family protein [Candidatus Gracilibacteria bacterium]|nr:diacylglycerol kinase family protein [Candidatus Gracilibacteria bacterium]
MPQAEAVRPARFVGDAESAVVDYSLAKLLRAFRYAFGGLGYLLRTQRNAQIHCLIGLCALALGAFLGLARWEWLALVLTIALVLAAEGVNTAIEAAVDVATEAYHPLARVAKDVAAGAVLICAIAAVIVGCIIFLPHLVPRIIATLSLLT